MLPFQLQEVGKKESVAKWKKRKEKKKKKKQFGKKTNIKLQI